jgi:hypothetical protein
MDNKLIIELFEYIVSRDILATYNFKNYEEDIVLEKMKKALNKLSENEINLIKLNFINKDKRQSIIKILDKLDQIIYQNALESKLTANTKGFYFKAIESDLSIITDESKNNIILFDKKNKKFQLVYGSYGNWFGGEIKFSKEYKLNEILDLSLIEINSTVIKKSNNIVKIIASGLLFGPIGVLAGAIDKGGAQRSMTKNSYGLRFSLNDVDLAVVDLKCSSSEIAERVINTIKLIKDSK